MKRFNALLGALLLAAAAGAGAHGAHGHHNGPVRKEQIDWGIAADAGAAQRTIAVTMGDDMRFTPDHIDVRQGETVKIVVKNAGAMLHEFVLGNEQELKEHAALMRKFPNMEHDEPYMAHVAPGQSGEIVWTFNRRGHFEFACLQPGHYEAGMRGTVDVAGASGGAVSGAAPAQAAAVPVAAAADAMTAGEVRKVDTENGKITLRHGAIRNLDMPPMTMVFRVRDPALLQQVHVGDKVLFEAELDDGKLTVTKLEPAH